MKKQHKIFKASVTLSKLAIRGDIRCVASWLNLWRVDIVYNSDLTLAIRRGELPVDEIGI